MALYKCCIIIIIIVSNVPRRSGKNGVRPTVVHTRHDEGMDERLHGVSV